MKTTNAFNIWKAQKLPQKRQKDQKPTYQQPDILLTQNPHSDPSQ